jgi:hypothetical protein
MGSTLRGAWKIISGASLFWGSGSEKKKIKHLRLNYC